MAAVGCAMFVGAPPAGCPVRSATAQLETFSRSTLMPLNTARRVLSGPALVEVVFDKVALVIVALAGVRLVTVTVVTVVVESLPLRSGLRFAKSGQVRKER